MATCWDLEWGICIRMNFGRCGGRVMLGWAAEARIPYE